jgi:hypothetical protein
VNFAQAGVSLNSHCEGTPLILIVPAKREGGKTMETNQTQQEATMQAEPQKEHQWLQKLVGEWTYETEAIMEPDQPP